MGGVCGKDKNEGPPKPTDKNTIKLLTLGVSGCGKSTFTKQMKILHTDGFQDFEISNFKSIVTRNITSGLREISIYILDHCEDQVTEKVTELLQYFQKNSNLDLTDETAVENCKELWGNEDVRRVYDEIKFSVHFPHIDYYMAKFDAIVDPDYTPDNEDIVRCRQATIGASTTSFWREKFWWKIIDVGGHTPERAKWGSIVKDGINAMIYFAALDDYATTSGEENGKTKMDISKLVWDEVVNSELFSGEATLLFLNKVDLFKEQIENESQFELFKETFPDYEGPQDVEQATEFIKETYLEKSTRTDPKDIYAHATCAIDTESMSVIWNTLKENIFKQRLLASGMEY